MKKQQKNLLIDLKPAEADLLSFAAQAIHHPDIVLRLADNEVTSVRASKIMRIMLDDLQSKNARYNYMANRFLTTSEAQRKIYKRLFATK